MPKIYHLTKRETWEKALDQKVYDFCTLKKDGFIHFSTESQFLDTANRIFSGQKDLILLEVEEESVKKDLKYENLEGGKEQFPHLYCSLKTELVIRVHPLEANQKGIFVSPFDQ